MRTEGFNNPYAIWAGFIKFLILIIRNLRPTFSAKWYEVILSTNIYKIL